MIKKPATGRTVVDISAKVGMKGLKWVNVWEGAPHGGKLFKIGLLKKYKTVNWLVLKIRMEEA